MADGQQNEWQNWVTIAWEAVKYILAALGAVASSAVLWMAKSYHARVAMLLRHESWIGGEDSKRGEIMAAVRMLKREDEKLHRRIALRRKEHEETKQDVAEIKTHLLYIRQSIDEMKTK